MGAGKLSNLKVEKEKRGVIFSIWDDGGTGKGTKIASKLRDLVHLS